MKMLKLNKNLVLIKKKQNALNCLVRHYIVLFFPPKTAWLELQYQPVTEVERFVVHDLISNAARKLFGREGDWEVEDL